MCRGEGSRCDVRSRARIYIYKFVKHRVQNYPKLNTARLSRVLKMIVMMAAVIRPTFAASSGTYRVEKEAKLTPRVTRNPHGAKHVIKESNTLGTRRMGRRDDHKREHERTSVRWRREKRSHVRAVPFPKSSLSTHASSDQPRRPPPLLHL